MNNTKDLAMQGEQSLVVSAGPAALAFANYGFNDMFAMAQTVSKGGLFPQFKTPEQTLSLMLLCQAKGLHPMQAVERYDIVQGRPAMKAQAMQAAFQAEGGKVQFHQSDDTMCDATFSHSAGGSLRLTWDLARANAAGITNKDTWRKHPGQMLRARCVSEGVRAILPGVVLGIYTPEETADFEPLPPAPPRDVTPATPVVQSDAPRPNRLIPPHMREGRAQAQSTSGEGRPKEDPEEVAKAKAAFVTAADRIGLPFGNAKERGEWANRSLGSAPESATPIYIADWYKAAGNIEETFNIANQANFGNDNYVPTTAPAAAPDQPEPAAAPPAKTEADTDAGDEDLKDPFAE